MANTVAWGLLKGDRWCMIVVCHWLKPAWQNMASLLSVVGSGIPHSMPQGGKSYHLIFKKPPLVRGCWGGGAALSGVGFLRAGIMSILLPSCMSLSLLLPAPPSRLGPRPHRQGRGL